ncbi:MAG: NifB/NifX family molybdenum-iron cluster-binding protein [Elusimicrobiota bacterium]
MKEGLAQEAVLSAVSCAESKGEKIMKVCLTSTGKSLDSKLDSRFGRCAYFIFLDTEDSENFESLANAAANASHGAGIQASQFVMEKKPAAVITGNIGPNASSVLSNAGIKVYTFTAEGSVMEALTALKKGKLKAAAGPTVGSHFKADSGS